MLDKKSAEKSDFKAFVKAAGSDDFVFVLNLDKNVISLSEDVVKVLSIPDREFDNAFEVMSELVHPDDKELFEKGIERIKNGGESDFIAEYRFKNEKNNYSPIQLNLIIC